MPPKRKKKMLVIKDEPKIPVGYVRGDDGKLRKKNFLKDVKPLQNISAHASALSASASAQNSTSRMEFPDDISSLITQFAKPIKDRGLIKTNPSKWTKVDKSKFIDYLQSDELAFSGEYDFAYAPMDDDGPRFDMESEYYEENMEAYFDIHNENMIESLLVEGSTGKLDGKTYRELGNILGDLMEDVIYFNEYSGKPFSDRLRARFERDEDNKTNASLKKIMLEEIVDAIDSYIPQSYVPSEDRVVDRFPSVSKKMLTLNIKNQAYFEKIKKVFELDDINLLDTLSERILETLYASDTINNEELYELEQEDIDEIENKTKEFIDIFIKRLLNDMLKSVPVDELLRSVYYLYDGDQYEGGFYENDDKLNGGETDYSEKYSVSSNFGSFMHNTDY